MSTDTVLGKISANDPDGTTVTFQLRGDGFEYFEIDEFSGEVTVKKSLDYERLPNSGQIKMQIVVKDEDLQTSTANAIVFVRDVNDNEPRFVNISFIQRIPEDQTVPKEIYTISVTDTDIANDVLSVECVGTTDLVS